MFPFRVSALVYHIRRSCLDQLLLPAANEAAGYLGRALGVEDPGLLGLGQLGAGAPQAHGGQGQQQSAAAPTSWEPRSEVSFDFAQGVKGQPQQQPQQWRGSAGGGGKAGDPADATFASWGGAGSGGPRTAWLSNDQLQGGGDGKGQGEEEGEQRATGSTERYGTGLAEAGTGSLGRWGGAGRAQGQLEQPEVVVRAPGGHAVHVSVNLAGAGAQSPVRAVMQQRLDLGSEGVGSAGSVARGTGGGAGDVGRGRYGPSGEAVNLTVSSGGGSAGAGAPVGDMAMGVGVGCGLVGDALRRQQQLTTTPVRVSVRFPRYDTGAMADRAAGL